MREDNFDNDSENGEEEVEIFTLIDEDEQESEFVLIKRIDIDGQSYVAFEPYREDGDAPYNSDEEDEEEDSFVILKVVEEEGDEIFVTIDDDEEFDRVADIFEDELMQDMEYDDSGAEDD